MTHPPRLSSEFDLDGEGLIECAEMYSKYEDWCAINNVRPVICNTVFGKHLKEVRLSRKYYLPSHKYLSENPPNTKQCERTDARLTLI